MSQVEGKALMSTLDEAAPTHPTACAGWTARDIVAHPPQARKGSRI